MKRKETGFFARLRAYTPDRFQQTIFWITLALFVSNVLSAVFADEQQDASRFIFSAFSCFGMLVVIALPVLATRFFRVKIPRMIQLVYVVFAFCGIVLGDVINFFDRFKYWDAILHFISGVLLASLGFILINTLNKADSVSLRISPIYVAVSVLLCGHGRRNLGDCRVLLRRSVRHEYADLSGFHHRLAGGQERRLSRRP